MEGDRRKMVRGTRIYVADLGEIYLRRTKRKPPGFEISVNGYYAKNSENHPFQRMRSTAIFFLVITFLGLTGNINFTACFLPALKIWLVPSVLFITAITLLLKWVYLIPIASLVVLFQQIFCYSRFSFDSELHRYLHGFFFLIFMFWSIREVKTIRDTIRHKAELDKSGSQEILDL